MNLLSCKYWCLVVLYLLFLEKFLDFSRAGSIDKIDFWQSDFHISHTFNDIDGKHM